MDDTTTIVATILASLLDLRQRTHAAHWMVSGPNFYGLHKMFEDQYNKLLELADRVAEHMRTLGERPPLTLGEVTTASILQPPTLHHQSSREMLSALLIDFDALAEFVNDPPDFNRAWSNIADDIHEYLTQQAWFLRSTLSVGL